MLIFGFNIMFTFSLYQFGGKARFVLIGCDDEIRWILMKESENLYMFSR